MMLRKKSRRNRRVWRESYLLEVKTPLNRRFSRQAEWLSRAAPIAIVAVICALVAWGGFSFLRQQFLYKNPAYTLRKIEAISDGAIPGDELARWSGVQRGQNLAALDVAKIQKQLELVPLVRRVQVKKNFPDQLAIRVWERVAVAKLVPTGAQATYFVDDEAVVFSAVRSRDGRVLVPMGAKVLPAITGVNASQITLGKPLAVDGVAQAIQTIRLCEKIALLPLLDLRAVDVSQPTMLRLVVGRGGAIFLEPQDIEAQLQRLHVIVWRAKSERRELRTADLRGARSVAVTYF